MDNVLLTRAQEAGAMVMENTYASGLLFENDGVIGLQLRDKDRRSFEIKGSLMLDATGRSRAFVRYVEKAADRSEPKRAGFVAFKAHLDNAVVTDGDCEIYAYRGGYGGCVRVENRLHNLCFIVPAGIAKRFSGNAAEIMQKIVLKNKRAAITLSGARIVDEWLAVPIERYGLGDLAPAKGLLTVGDAAAFIDPFTGSGILLALESAKIAAGVIAHTFKQDGLSFKDVEQTYKLRYAAAFDSRLRVSSMLRRAAFVPFLADTVIRGLAISDRLTRRVAMATRVKMSG
jgi:flavin-dependent dehydrogenase